MIDKISFGIEIRSQQWDASSSFINDSNTQYKNLLQLSTGFEIIPDAEMLIVFSKELHRGGILLKKSPLIINGNQLNTTAVTFGLSLPIGTISRINLGFEAGKRGI